MFLKYVLGIGFGPLAASGGLCFDTPETSAGGGTPATPDASTTTGGTPPTPDAADAGAPGATAQPDLDDDEDDDLDDGRDADVIARELPEATLRTQHRRAQRKLAKMRPIVDTLRDPQTGKLLSREQLGRLMQNARDFDPVDRVFQHSPRAFQVFQEERDRLEGRTSATAPAPEADIPFDQSQQFRDWPYETDTPQGKQLLAIARDAYDTKQQLQKTNRLLEQLQQGTTRQTEAQIEQTWKGETFAASQEVDPAYRGLFINSVYQHFELLKVRKQLGSTTPKAVIDKALAAVRAERKRTTRQTTARQSAAAVGTQQQPRTPQPGAMTPTTGKQPSGERETLKHARGSFFTRAGKG